MKGLPIIDLSTLQFPPVLEELSYEDILAGARQKFIEFWTALRADYPALPPYSVEMLESDPGMIVLQALAYREMLTRGRINDTAKALMLATATGADLEAFAADFALVKATLSPATGDSPAVMESDDDLRARRRIAPDGYAAAGPEDAYRFHALTVAPWLKDVEPIKGENGRVDLVLLGRAGDGAVDAQTLAAVHERLSPRRLRPLTDALYVRSAAIVSQPVRIVGRPAAGPDRTLVRAQTLAALSTYASQRHAIGRTLYRDGLIGAARAGGGWETVSILEPAGDVDPGAYGAVHVPDITVEFSA